MKGEWFDHFATEAQVRPDGSSVSSINRANQTHFLLFRTEAEEPGETKKEDEPSSAQTETTQPSYEPDLSLSIDVVPSPPPTSRVWYNCIQLNLRSHEYLDAHS